MVGQDTSCSSSPLEEKRDEGSLGWETLEPRSAESGSAPLAVFGELFCLCARRWLLFIF